MNLTQCLLFLIVSFIFFRHRLGNRQVLINKAPNRRPKNFTHNYITLPCGPKTLSSKESFLSSTSVMIPTAVIVLLMLAILNNKSGWTFLPTPALP